MMAAEAAGLVIAIGPDQRFLPAALVQQVVPRPVVSEVPGSPLGMALIDGRVVAVMQLGPERDPLIACGGELADMALCGLRVVASGSFETAPGGIRIDGTVVAPLDPKDAWQRAQQPAPPIREQPATAAPELTRDLPAPVTAVREVLTQADWVAVNAALTGARLDEPSRRALAAFSQEIRTLLARALATLDEPAAARAGAKPGREP